MISLPRIESILMEYFSKTAESRKIDGPLLAVEAEDEENPEIVLVTPLTINREDANKVLREAGLSGLHSIRRVLHIAALPVLGTGKTDYRKLKTFLS